jgi:hypothetical protein
LLNTGVEKGFMIFLMATAVPPSWSLAELCRSDGRWSQVEWRKEDVRGKERVRKDRESRWVIQEVAIIDAQV